MAPKSIMESKVRLLAITERGLKDNELIHLLELEISLTGGKEQESQCGFFSVPSTDQE